MQARPMDERGSCTLTRCNRDTVRFASRLLDAPGTRREVGRAFLSFSLFAVWSTGRLNGVAAGQTGRRANEPACERATDRPTDRPFQRPCDRTTDQRSAD